MHSAPRETDGRSAEHSTSIRLTGRLLCRDDADAAVVREHLARHVDLTRAEAGCLRFSVTPSEDPLVWDVDELFTDAAAFEAHQRRVRESEWGRATEGIPRDYRIDGL